MKQYYDEGNKRIKSLLSRTFIINNKVRTSKKSCGCCSYLGVHDLSLMDLYFIEDLDLRDGWNVEWNTDESRIKCFEYNRIIIKSEKMIFPILKKYRSVFIINKLIGNHSLYDVIYYK